MNRSSVRAGAMPTVAAWLTALGMTTALAAGSNDDRSGAVPIASLPTTFAANNDGATAEAGDRWNNTVWYAYTPAVTGKVAMRAGGPFDNTLEVWAGGSMVVQNDDYYRLDAMLVFPATTGTTYLIGLGSYSSGRTGTATVYVRRPAPRHERGGSRRGRCRCDGNPGRARSPTRRRGSCSRRGARACPGTRTACT